MKCDIKEIECMFWDGVECEKQKCPYEEFNPFNAVEKIMEKWNDKEQKPERDLSKIF